MKKYLIKKVIFIALIISLNVLSVKCGIPTSDFIQQYNVPYINHGSATDNGDGSYEYLNITKSYNATFSRWEVEIRIQAYQPEDGFTGFNIYIENTAYSSAPLSALQIARANHYYYDSSTGQYSKMLATESTYIVPAGSASSGSRPSITVMELGTITATNPSGSVVYPTIKTTPVEFRYTIGWDGRGQNFLTGRIYYIALTAVDPASKLESALSNVIQIKFS